MKPANIRKFDSLATTACLGVILFWTLGPICIKLLTAHIDSWTQNLLRYSAACLFWLPYLFYVSRKKQFEPKIWRKALYPAGANIIMQSLWAAAFYYIDPALMILLAKSAIVWIAFFSIIFFAQERPLVKSKRFWIGMLLSIIGIIGAMCLEEGFGTKKTVLGITITLGAAFMWAVYAISAKIAFRNIDSRIGFSVMSIYTVAGLAVLAMIFGDIGQCLQMGVLPWAYVFFSGISAIALGHVLYYTAIKRIGATIPSLALLVTPFTTLAISRVVFGETLTPLQWLFGIVLLIGGGLAIWSQQHLK